MTAKDALQKIAAMVKSLNFGDQTQPVATPPATEPAKFMDVKTKDGVVLSVDKMEPGGSVILNGAPAADGTYQLEDGSEITVAGGVITEVSKGEVPNPLEEEMKKMDSKFADQKNELEATRDELKKAKDEIVKLQDVVKQMFSLVETLSNNSIQQPIEKPKTFTEMSPLERFRASKNMFN